MLSDAKDSVTCVSAGAGGAEIVTASVDGQVRTYDLRMGRMIAEDVTHPITSFALTSDGTCIASSCLDGAIRFWERTHPCTATPGTTLDVLRTFRSSHKAGNFGLECSLSADDRYVVSGSEDGVVVVYDTESQPEERKSRSGSGDSKRRSRIVEEAARRLVGHTGPACSVACCPDISRASVVVSAGYDGSAIVWANEEEAQRILEEQ